MINYGKEINKIHMKLTPRQRQEVEFLQEYKSFTATDEQIDEYVHSTVHGRGEAGKLTDNPLHHTQNRWNLILTTWLEDLSAGLLSVDELYDDPTLQNPYAKRCIKRIHKQVWPNPSCHTLASAKNALTNSIGWGDRLAAVRKETCYVVS